MSTATARPGCRRCSGVALDLGSARTRARIGGPGVVLEGPTIAWPGAVRPVRRGAIVDTPGTSRVLERLLGDRLSGPRRPLVVVAVPALGGVAFRTEARTAVEVLRPRAVLTVPAARAVACAAGADPARTLLVVDAGAQLTEVVLLADGAVVDARCTVLGTDDLDDATTVMDLVEAVTGMVTAMLGQDRTSQTADALRRGPLLAGGGALRPGFADRLTDRLHAPVRPLPAPHTATVRGAAALLTAAHGHPSAGDEVHPAARPHQGRSGGSGGHEAAVPDRPR
ncbi:rod shape-determining protein [Streptomyces sp. HUAS TT20]|uniref:rod shape-determining protein n=1 Tax=Streptomyces sp. HUAS TT20 TaxID=3447509 RepID=UPI0021DAC0C1|nr:rod shape-determining protein [Streptomyces sp. HUAS 15-9]UXY31125.1 rod shape-determining protein [Streptomyces sp. HUAS 15-9]